mgnify:CR=1 FL=1
MHGKHLRRRGQWWHYYRNRPKRYENVEFRPIITFALRTTSTSEAKLKAAEISCELERQWEDAKRRRVSLSSQIATESYEVAMQTNHALGFIPTPTYQINDTDLIERFRAMLSTPISLGEKKAVLGLVERPKLSLISAFDRFWSHIEDEWVNHSHDQRRCKRNIYLKAIRHFEEAVGPIAIYDIQRENAIAFRSWWMKRKKENNLKSYTANREIGCLRRLLSTSFEIDGRDEKNPFERVKLKEEKTITRSPVTSFQIKERILAPGKLDGLHSDFQILVRLVINTGMRPVEAIGLKNSEIVLDANVPHVHVRQNSVRVLKTAHSERKIPLVGVSYEAAKLLQSQGGWGKRIGKNMYATSIINRHFKENKTLEGDRQSFYSLRHWFSDQLVQMEVIDRIQCQLMGHRFQRPIYGDGAPLNMLRDIIAKFAL